MFELAKGPQPLAHLAPQAKFPSPFRRVPAPDASALPMPSTMPTKSPIRSPPEPTRRSTNQTSDEQGTG